MQCVACRQSDQPDEPEPDIAPATSMAYPSPVEVAQACAAQLQQHQLKAVEQGVLNGVSKAVKTAIEPVANSVQAIAAEFRRMTGKLDV